MTGVTTIIGSGWLLSTQKIAQLAGPASILAWVIGAFVALLVGLFYIEIGSIYRSSGGIGYYSHVTHGRFCGFLTSWINWLSIVAVPPIEAQGIVQYLSQINGEFSHLYNVTSHNLTTPGLIVAGFLMILFMAINYWSVQLFLRFNNLFTIIKIAVPLLTIAVLAYSGLHLQNFGGSLTEFMPQGFSAILISVVSSGVVMSFNGFQSPLNFSEEIANPRRMLPIAVVSSIVLAFFVYFLLQAVFIGSINPTEVIAKGWHNINLRSPYVELLLLANMHLMVIGIYMGAVISPAACGAAFVASSSRILYSLSHERHMPKYLSILNPSYQNPRHAIVTCTAVGFLFLFLFKGWYSLVAVVSVLHIFSYLPAPIVTIANRMKHKHFLEQKKHHFVMPFAQILAVPLLFVLSVMIFYAGWPLEYEMALFILPGFLFYFYYEYKTYQGRGFAKMFIDTLWLIIHILGVTLITYLGNNLNTPIQLISTATSMFALGILSLFTYVLGAYLTYDKAEYHHPRLEPLHSATELSQSDKLYSMG